MRRTSFAVISSLSRFSLSFALIVQHLQAKKNTVQRSHLRTATLFAQKYQKLTSINPHHNRCAGESGVLFFVLPVYYTTPNSFCQVLFSKKQKNIFRIFHFLVRHTLSIGKSYKNANQNVVHFLTCMLFHKFFCQFSSQLNIYKSTTLRYNITC